MARRGRGATPNQRVHDAAAVTHDTQINALRAVGGIAFNKLTGLLNDPRPVAVQFKLRL